MTCTEARDALLVADMAELRGESDTPLATHVQTCAECGRVASVILRGTAGLERSALGAKRRRQTTDRFALLAVLPIAAAVVVAVAINARSPGQVSSPRAVSSLPVVRQVSVEVARGQHATVFRTADPKVTVIWVSFGEGK